MMVSLYANGYSNVFENVSTIIQSKDEITFYSHTKNLATIKRDKAVMISISPFDNKKELAQAFDVNCEGCAGDCSECIK